MSVRLILFGGKAWESFEYQSYPEAWLVSSALELKLTHFLPDVSIPSNPKANSGWMGVPSPPADGATNESAPSSPSPESSLEKMHLAINDLGKGGVKMSSFVGE